MFERSDPPKHRRYVGIESNGGKEGKKKNRERTGEI